MTTGRKVGAAVVLVALLAGVLWWLAPAEETPLELRSAPVPAALPAAPSPRETKGRVRSGTSKEADESAAEASLPEEVSISVPELAGVVIGADRGQLAGAIAFAIDETGSVRKILGDSAIRRTGTFEIDLPSDAVQEGREVEVWVWVSGFRREAKRATLQPGVTQRLEFRVERGLAIFGTVVKGDGVPVPELRLLVRPATYAPRIVTGADLDVDASVAAPFDPVEWTRTVTDVAGRFVATGLGEGKYGFYSQDSAWILRTDDVIPAGTEDVRVVAVPARNVVLRVKDAVTGKPIECQAQLRFMRQSEHGSSSSSRSIDVSGGELRVGWDQEDVATRMLPPDEDDPGTLTASLRLSVEGYNVRTVPIALDAPGPLLLDVELEPIVDSTIGHMRLEVVDGRGEPVDYPITVWLHGDPPDHKEPETNRLSKEAPGRFVLGVSPGHWEMTVKPTDAVIGKIEDRRPIEVVAGGSTDLRIVLPPSGHVVVRRKARQGKMPSLAIGTSDGNGSSISTVTDEREVRWRLEPGTWKIEIGEGDTETKHDVVVRPYEETVLETDR